MDRIFYWQATAGADGKTGLTVAGAVKRWRIPRATGTAEALADDSAVEIGMGFYSYRWADVDPATYDYLAVFVTADATVALKAMGSLWSEYSPAAGSLTDGGGTATVAIKRLAIVNTEDAAVEISGKPYGVRVSGISNESISAIGVYVTSDSETGYEIVAKRIGGDLMGRVIGTQISVPFGVIPIQGVGVWAAGAAGAAIMLGSAYTAPDNAGIADTEAAVGTAKTEILAAIAGVAESAGTGDGDTPVDHNTGGADALRYLVGTAGADNVDIRAYLKSDYDAGSRTVRGTTHTGSDGRWVAPLMLDAGVYYLVARIPGVTEASVQQITVS